MKMELLKYNGFILYDWGNRYKSEINGQWITFDTASQWKSYIDKFGRR